jgi:DNA-binding CsgD family transcriptional regulator
MLFDALRAELSNISRSSCDGSVMGLLGQIIGGDVVVHYRFGLHDDGVRLRRHGASSDFVPASFFKRLARGLATGELDFLFSARAPEPVQRNRPVVVPGPRQLLSADRATLARYGRTTVSTGLRRLIAILDDYDLAEHPQLRVPICDGAAVIEYLGVLQRRPFTARQRFVFRKIVDVVRERALLDRRLEDADGFQDALEVALETLGRAAFIVDRAHRIVHANTLGRLRAGKTLERTSFEVHPIRAGASYELWLDRMPTLAERADALATRLALSPQARRVVLLAADGCANVTIAAQLGLAEKTVEYHLSRAFAKIGVADRYQLVRYLAES